MNRITSIEQDLYALYASINPSPVFARLLRSQLVNRASQLEQANNLFSNRLLIGLKSAWQWSLGVAALALVVTLIAFSLRLVPPGPASSLPASQPINSGTPPQTTLPASLTEPENRECLLKYRVREGDVWLGIAQAFNLTVEELLALNERVSSDPLVSGEVLVVGQVDGQNAACDQMVTPVPRMLPTLPPLANGGDCVLKYRVQNGDTVNGIAYTFGLSVEELAMINGMSEYEFEMLSVGQQLIVRKDPACSP